MRMERLLTLNIFVADISKRKLLKQQLQDLNATMDQRIEQRTVELPLANKELEDCGELIPEEGRAYLERIRNAAQRMGRIIEDMLFLSQITRSPMDFQSTDISGMVLSVMEDLARENPGRKVQWTVEPGKAAVCDQRLMRIVFGNLLNNAWEFSSMSGEAMVSVDSFKDSGKGTVFFVRDNGTGFDHRLKDELFTAF